jgi:hypothetical protein
LQGTSEKIQFDSLVCQYPFKSKDLLAQYQLAGSSNWSVCILQPVTPVVEQVTSDPELPRKPRDVVARVHPLYGLLPKFLAVSLTLFVVHCEPPSRKVCNTEAPQYIPRSFFAALFQNPSHRSESPQGSL